MICYTNYGVKSVEYTCNFDCINKLYLYLMSNPFYFQPQLKHCSLTTQYVHATLFYFKCCSKHLFQSTSYKSWQLFLTGQLLSTTMLAGLLPASQRGCTIYHSYEITSEMSGLECGSQIRYKQRNCFEHYKYILYLCASRNIV